MRFVLGFVAALVLLAVAAGALVWNGGYNIAASEPHAPVVRWTLDSVMRNSVRPRAAAVRAPKRFTDEQVRLGFVEFDAMCVQCHGAPGEKPAEWARGMRPQPPDLSRQTVHWTAAELFWIVKHGIKMSAMPAFGATHGDDAVWSIVAFIEQLPAVTPEAYRQMQTQADGRGHGGHVPGGG